MSTSNSQRQPSPGLKRQRRTNRTPSPLPTSNKKRTSFNLAAETLTAYWDNLSTVYLSPSLLNEIDRRARRHGRIAIEGPSGLRSGKTAELSTQLNRACRQGGLDLRHLRGYSSLKAVNPALSGPDTEMNEEHRIGTLDPNFGQHLSDYEIHGEDSDLTKPNNWNELRSMVVARPRQIIPSESYDAQYKAFRQATRENVHTRDVRKNITPLIRGSSPFYSDSGHSFQNIRDMTDGNIVKVQPDFYDGVHYSLLEKNIYTELRPFIRPLVAKITPVVPNFFGVFKGNESSASEVELLARYSGAIGARGIHRLRSFGVRIEDQETVYDNKAYTISATYYYGLLTLYAHRPIAPSVPGGLDRYRMTRIRRFDLGDGPGAFRKGVAALLNAREWAREMRDKLVAAANARAQTTTRTQDADDGEDADDGQDANDGEDTDDGQDAEDLQNADDWQDEDE